MYWQVNTYAIALFGTAVTSALLAYYMWRRRDSPGALALSLLTLAVAQWSFGYAFELSSPTLQTKLFWTNFNFVGIVTIPVAWCIWAFQYTHRDRWLTGRNIVLLSLPALMTLILTWTNDAHHLIRSQVNLDTNGPIPMLDPVYGQAFWMFWGYAFVLTLMSSGIILYMLVTSPRLYREQAAALLLITVLPWIGNALYHSGLSPFHKLDLTPFSFTLVGLIMAWNLSRYRLLDIVPVARDAVIENMRDGVVVLDTRGRVVDINLAGQDIFGHNLIGEPAVQVLPGWATWAHRYPATADMQIELAVGEGQAQHYFDVKVSPLYNRREQFTGQLVVFRDITERRRVEETLRSRNEELDAFAHTVAHDLKSPLTSIVGFSGVLEKRFQRMPADEVSYYLGVIGLSGRKMSNIIDELLLLASMRKLEDLPIGPLDMAEIVSEARKRVADAEAALQAELIMPDTWPIALGYGPWVEEVWVNYLSNALKYGGRPPRIELGAELLSEQEARFWVHDNGPGIPLEAQARLFTLFTRLNQVRAKGHGLGLSIVRRIIEKLSGNVGVDSVTSVGSTFWFTLPVEQSKLME